MHSIINSNCQCGIAGDLPVPLSIPMNIAFVHPDFGIGISIECDVTYVEFHRRC